MNRKLSHRVSANPASHEPSKALPARCTCCGGARGLEPDERRIRMLDRMAELGMERIERHAEEDREEAAARRHMPRPSA